MIAAPAIDIREGRCVQLVGGDPAAERVSLPDPLAVARHWWDIGFRALHVVDLDAAFGDGDNLAVVIDVLSETDATTQVGGGIREDGVADRLLAGGADRIVVGTRAVDEPDWLAQLADRYPGRIMVAADVRGQHVLRRGWTEEAGLELAEFLARLRELPLAGILCTDVAREGRMEGIDLATAERRIVAAHRPVWISGGITTLEELRALRMFGAAGAVLGMALYTGKLDARAVADEFGGGANQ
ncbi:MAG: 1-(5-phosphoribosyl)-5-[(5-phosphoribosylamino)methylideneamino] imidazole-4-carboxamide isomerase [Gemmatimonadetes bacterium]|nr:1-(5-phosphoribosyl)-5-[(5-phosphoribosylamino)methylideneamino] imidazole-4-carboxamide isomerase [Gemmatimonadota bacterium]